MLKSPQYPQYLMLIGAQRRFLPIREAGVAYDCGFVNVEIVGDVLEEDHRVRLITDEERRKIAEIAEEWSTSK